MLITRETDYALRLLRTLSDGDQHTVEELCEAEMVPRQFAYKILRRLAKAGMVQSFRGREGGCRLSCDLRRTTLYDLTTLLSEQQKIAACLHLDYQCSWQEKSDSCCRIHHRLCQVQTSLDETLRACTLHSLLAEDALAMHTLAAKGLTAENALAAGAPVKNAGSAAVSAVGVPDEKVLQTDG